SGFNYGSIGSADAYVVRAQCEDQDAIERLRGDRLGEIVGVFADPVLSPFPSSPSAYCGDAPVGATADVARRLGVPALRRAGLTGRGVHVAVVDTGIDGSRIPVAGGWAPTRGYVPGSSAPGHGTMVAYDVRIAAPDAQILDYALLKSQAGTWAASLSDGIAAFADLIERVGASPHGANSHPDVITVAAVTVTDRRLGYSSQGRGALYSRKPDLAGFSHFVGSRIYPADAGTSAASPVAAGVAAALRQRFATDRLAPAQLKGLLQRTARDVQGDGWDYDLGYGVIDAAGAVKGLGLKPKASVKSKLLKPKLRKGSQPTA